MYVKTKDIERSWDNWLQTNDEEAWEELNHYIYQICQGVAKKFRPPTTDDYHDHVFDAYAKVMDKIKRGKLTFESGKAPVFNLLTTAIFNILYSKVAKEEKDKKRMAAVREKLITQLSSSPQPTSRIRIKT